MLPYIQNLKQYSINNTLLTVIFQFMSTQTPDTNYSLEKCPVFCALDYAAQAYGHPDTKTWFDILYPRTNLDWLRFQAPLQVRSSVE